MADMNQVKASVSQHDFFPFLLMAIDDFDELFE
jgi:hypothetical protein